MEGHGFDQVLSDLSRRRDRAVAPRSCEEDGADPLLDHVRRDLCSGHDQIRRLFTESLAQMNRQEPLNVIDSKASNRLEWSMVRTAWAQI